MIKKLFLLFLLLLLVQVLQFTQNLKIGIYFSTISSQTDIESIDNKNSASYEKLENFIRELFKYLKIVGKRNSIFFTEETENVYTNFSIELSYDHVRNFIGIKCYQDKELVFEASGSMSSAETMEKMIIELADSILERISIIRLRFNDFEGLMRITFNQSIDEYPSFSKDGSLLAFISDRDTGNRDIYILDLNKMYVMRNNLPESSEYFPRISPDDTKLVFQSTRGGKWTIWIQNIEELGKTTSLEHIPTLRNSYTPSCDERGVYFVQETGNNTEIFFYDFSSKRIIKLLESEDEEFSPSPSRIGLVFVKMKKNGDSGIYLLESDGKVISLEDSPFNEFDPIITSDNKWLIFSSNRDGIYRLWLKNLSSGIIYKLTNQKTGDAFYPTIFEDTVVFSMYSKSEPDLWAVSIQKFKDIEKRRYLLLDKTKKLIKLLEN